MDGCEVGAVGLEVVAGDIVLGASDGLAVGGIVSVRVGNGVGTSDG
jgi:hypothetical protein